MALRKLPPRIKIYEALWAIADGRLELDGMFASQGSCSSASHKKSYTINYNSETNTITSNDSGAMNQGYIGYPAIAFLLKIWKLTYNPDLLPMLKNINRAAIKQQVNKDHEETLRLLLGQLFQAWHDVDALVAECGRIYQQLEHLQLSH